MDILVKNLKSLVFLWGLGVSMLGGLVTAYTNCQECLTEYPALISIGFTLVSQFILVIVIVTIAKPIVKSTQEAIEQSRVVSEQRFRSLREAHLISEIDRLYKRHENSQTLTADEYKYASHLFDVLKELGLNSFNERKITHILNKDITS